MLGSVSHATIVKDHTMENTAAIHVAIVKQIAAILSGDGACKGVPLDTLEKTAENAVLKAGMEQIAGACVGVMEVIPVIQ